MRTIFDADATWLEQISPASTSPSKGLPGTPSFNADEYLDEVDRLGRMGVTTLSLTVPGDAINRAEDAIEEFGQTVVGQQHESAVS